MEKVYLELVGAYKIGDGGDVDRITQLRSRVSQDDGPYSVTITTGNHPGW